jgi:predicted dehydrogenase
MDRRDFIHQSAFAAMSFSMPNITGLVNPRQQKPLRIGVAGLVHTHVHWILGREKTGDIEIAGIAEPNRDLAARYAKQHGFSLDIVFNTLEEMVAATRPEAVTAFTNTYDHLKVVQLCAPRGIHIMVEKPLAVNMDHAKQMAALAKKHNVLLLTNYETSWYGTHQRAWQYIMEQQKAGELRKIVFQTGHPGPFEIGCNVEFTDWLTDPVLNGAGVLTDFGCYGANMSTWLMRGQKPSSVLCTTQQVKPKMYPKVEDECTILLKYKKAQVVIQASWNWPFNRKDMAVYGQHGYVFCEDRSNLHYRWKDMEKPLKETIAENAAPLNDPFSFLGAAIRKDVRMQPFDLSSLENNLLVMEILDAARLSAAKGIAVSLL